MTPIPESISTYVLYALAFPTVFWLVAYLIPQVYMSTIRAVPNLRERYPGASWALVTGSGSGIGRALSFKLADQGLNVVLDSLDDDHLKRTKQGQQRRKRGTQRQQRRRRLSSLSYFLFFGRAHDRQSHRFVFLLDT